VLTWASCSRQQIVAVLPGEFPVLQCLLAASPCVYGCHNNQALEIWLYCPCSRSANTHALPPGAVLSRHFDTLQSSTRFCCRGVGPGTLQQDAARKERMIICLSPMPAAASLSPAFWLGKSVCCHCTWTRACRTYISQMLRTPPHAISAHHRMPLARCCTHHRMPLVLTTV